MLKSWILGVVNGVVFADPVENSENPTVQRSPTLVNVDKLDSRSVNGFVFPDPVENSENPTVQHSPTSASVEKPREVPEAFQHILAVDAGPTVSPPWP